MKKFVCIMILACLVFSAAYAQQKQPAAPAPAPAKPAPAPEPTPTKKSAFGLDVFRLLEGVIASDSDNDQTFFILSGDYESLIAPHISICADVTALFYKYKIGDDTKDDLYLRIAAEGRYYTMSTGLDKFFLGTTVGFVSYSHAGSTSTDKGGYQGLSTSLKVGYKQILSNLYLEPYLSYVTEEGKSGSFWQGGLRLGLLF